MTMRIAKLTLLILVAGATGVMTLAAATPTATASGAQDAAALYKSKCASCHAADGSGNTAKGKELKLRDLRSAEVQKLTDKQLYDITAKGKGKMPGYEKSLGAEKVNQLVAHMRALAKK
jgi:cytochrome c6